MSALRLATAAFLLASPLLAQAVTERSTPSGLPVAVVEVGGGDVEHIAALIPSEATPPAQIAGFPVRAESGRGGLSVCVTVPALLASQAVEELAGVLTAGGGAAAVVALGPVGAGELAGALASLGPVPVRPLPRQGCAIAEGGVEVRRGDNEGVELRVVAPGPDDPRFDLLPIFATWLAAKLQPAFPGLAANNEMEGACSRIVLRLSTTADERPREALRRLRAALESLVGVTPAPAEIERATAVARRTLAAVAEDGAGWAVALAARRALGGEVASALVLPDSDPAAVAALATTVLRGHPGLAIVTEQERRSIAGTPEMLDNGAVLAWWSVPGEVGAAAVALGGIEPSAGRALLEAAAGNAAGHGWVAEVDDLFGVPTLAVAAPADELADVIERLSDAAQGNPAGELGGLDADIAHTLGLGQQPRADALSVALALPPEADDGREAAEKFFSQLPPAPVRSTPVFPAAGLSWTQEATTPTVAALVELPGSEAGLLAGVVLERRLRKEDGVSVRWLAPPTRVVLEVRGRGKAHVPALEQRLASTWKGVRRPLEAGVLEAAAHDLASRLLGDCVRVTARVAASPFLPSLPSAATLLAAEPAEIDAVIAKLPAWEGLPRVARGTAPLLPTPPERGTVRKSHQAPGRLRRAPRESGGGDRMVEAVNVKEQMDLLLKGCVDVVRAEDLEARLVAAARDRRPLTVKVGFDPSAPDLHLGHTVVIRKMRHFQQLGHRVVFLIGDFTGMIGDPTGKKATRPQLTREQVAANAETYKRQIFKLLDPATTVIDFNARWLGALTSEEWIRLTARVTLAQMLERDDFAKRLAAGEAISLHELLYPVAQAYDSVALKADVELGGTDQLFNLLVGRDLMGKLGLPPQIVMTLPLLEGLDGVEKMSKSLGNYVAVEDPPEEMFGKLMSISDVLMWRYWTLLSDRTPAEVDALSKAVARGERHPMHVKYELARTITADFHSPAAARDAEAHFRTVHQRRETPDEVPVVELGAGGEPLPLARLLVQASLAPSNSEARRLLQQGGVRVDGEVIVDAHASVAAGAGTALLVQVGKRRFARIVFAATAEKGEA